MISVGGIFDGTDAGYTQCTIDLQRLTVDTTKTYSAQMTFGLNNGNEHLVVITGVTPNP